jgi:hypothetical protein
METALQMFVVFGVPGAVFITSGWLRAQERLRILDVVRALAEQDKPLSAEIIQALPGGVAASTPQRDLRRGVMLIAVGLSFALLGLAAFTGLRSFAVSGAVAAGVGIAAIGAIPLCIGAALIYLSRADR